MKVIGIALLFVICFVAFVKADCSAFEVGTYDCSFVPSDFYQSYRPGYNSFEPEDFSITLKKLNNGEQSFTVDASFCPKSDSGTLTIIDQSNLVFQIGASCDYILFGNNDDSDPMTDCTYTANCDGFVGTAVDSTSNNVRGELSCALSNGNSNSNTKSNGSSNSSNNNNSSSSDSQLLLPSVFLMMGVILLGFLIM